MKLSAILDEMLDPATAAPYDISTPKVSKQEYTNRSVEYEYTFQFTNVGNKKMEITIPLQMDPPPDRRPLLTFSFGKWMKTSAVNDKYKTMTGDRDLNRILATVITAADYVIDENIPNGRSGLYAISYSPSDDRRDRIYRIFIQRYFPEFKFETDGKTYKTFVNQNYQPPQTQISPED